LSYKAAWDAIDAMNNLANLGLAVSGQACAVFKASAVIRCLTA